MFDSDQKNYDLLVNSNKLLDNSRIDDFIIFLYLCSDIIKFPSKRDNYWESFLLADNVVIYSLILHTDTDFIFRNSSKDLLAFSMIKDLNDKLNILDSILKNISDVLTVCVYWYENLTDKIIKSDIEDFLSKNIYKVQLLYDLIKNYQIQQSDEVKLFLDFVEKKLKLIDIELQHSGGGIGGDVNNSIKILTREINESSLMLINKLQNKIPNLLYQELYNGEHSPHMTLLYSYFFLMQKVGVKLNEVIERHLDYYYKGVLCEKKKGIIFDRSLIFCNLHEDIRSGTLPEGVRIFGGSDEEENDIIFRTAENVTIYRGNVDKIYTLEVSDINVSTFDNLPEVSIKIAEYNMQQIYEDREKLYLFSPEKSKSRLLQNTRFNDNFGMVISSHILYLSEGDRTINLKFHVTPESCSDIIEQTKKYGLYDGDNTLKSLTSLFLKAVKFQFTTEEGWMDLERSYVKPIIEGEYITLSLLIDENFSAITLPTKDNKFQYNDPSIKITCPSSDLLGYAILFLNLEFDSLEISVDVKGCKNLILQNELGVIENKISFYPFGSMPNQGSAFYIGNQEIFNKDLSSLEIQIEWQNLPKDGGFIKHYKNYPGKISGESFTANVYALKNQKWIPVDGKITINLFETEINNDRSYEELSNTTVINNLDLTSLNLKEMIPISPEKNNSYSFNTKDGFIKLELAGPDGGFGHFIYPKLISGSNLVKSKYLKKVIFNDINEPYTPIIKSIKINYSSAVEYKFNKQSVKENKFFAINKLNIFGHYKESFDKHHMTLFDFARNAYSLVYIGVKNVIEEKYLSLYFKIDDTSVNLKTYVPPSFCFLNGNFICNLSKEHIIEDETLGLRRSGKILIEIPQNIKTGTLLDNDKFWFAIMFEDTKNFLPTILGVYMNPVKVIRASTNTDYNLKPYSLSNILDPGYKEVDIVQPFESYGGKKAEDDEALYRRGSERLRHKGRGVTVWDYEHLILSKFPEISKVKCFKNEDDNDTHNVNVVVLNKIKEENENGHSFPRVSDIVLNKIRAFIKSKVSVFSNINIINPVYERIQFNFYLKIKPQYTQEQCIQYLNNSLKLYISPWLYSENKKYEDAIEIGQEINTSDIINFINSQEYVEGISNFVAIKYENNKITQIIKETNIIKPKYAWSIFYTDEKQMIKVVNEKDILQSKTVRGVNSFEIENDFIVGPIDYVNNNTDKIQNFELLEEDSIDDYYLFMRL